MLQPATRRADMLHSATHRTDMLHPATHRIRNLPEIFIQSALVTVYHRDGTRRTRPCISGSPLKRALTGEPAQARRARPCQLAWLMSCPCCTSHP